MRTLVAALFALFALEAPAAVLYKLVDPAGSITFSDSVPQGFRGSVTRLDIDTGPNVIRPSAPSVLQSPVDGQLVMRTPTGPSGEERLRQAAARIEEARAALANAQNNSVSEDWIYYPRNPTTGASRMPSPEYEQRLQQLAGNVVVAEAEYEALRNQLR
jgi:hypothetical protein